MRPRWMVVGQKQDSRPACGRLCARHASRPQPSCSGPRRGGGMRSCSDDPAPPHAETRRRSADAAGGCVLRCGCCALMLRWAGNPDEMMTSPHPSLPRLGRAGAGASSFEAGSMPDRASDGWDVAADSALVMLSRRSMCLHGRRIESSLRGAPDRRLHTKQARLGHDRAGKGVLTLASSAGRAPCFALSALAGTDLTLSGAAAGCERRELFRAAP